MRRARLALSVLLLAGTVSCRERVPIRPAPVSARELPRGAAFRGRFVRGLRWIDRLGENVMVLSQSGRIPAPQRECGSSDPCARAEVYAYHYVRGDGGVRLLWKTFDQEPPCDFDLYAAPIPGSLAVTDLDSDGVAESTFLYLLSCRSDVSPARLKLIMHEGTAKYAIRGSTRIASEHVGGERRLDPAFGDAPPRFREFALRQWSRFVDEREFRQFDR